MKSLITEPVFLWGVGIGIFVTELILTVFKKVGLLDISWFAIGVPIIIAFVIAVAGVINYLRKLSLF